MVLCVCDECRLGEGPRLCVGRCMGVRSVHGVCVCVFFFFLIFYLFIHLFLSRSGN